MNIGVVGSGNIGGTVGKLWARAGHNVLFSLSRDPEKLRRLADAAGPNARAGSLEEAARFGEVVLFSPPWILADEILHAICSLAGKVLIDTTNPFDLDPYGMHTGPGSSAGEQIAKRASGTKVVKAYNTLPLEMLVSEAGRTGSRRLVLFYSGDDNEAKALVATLISDSGFEPFDAGPLRNARYQEPGGFLFGRPVGLDEASELIIRLPES